MTGVAKLASANNGHERQHASVKHLPLNLIRYLPLLGCLVLAYFTFNRNAIYESEVSFWLDAVHKSPRKARAHNNLGYAYFVSGDLDHAIEQFHLAVQLQPSFSAARENLVKASQTKNCKDAAQ